MLNSLSILNQVNIGTGINLDLPNFGGIFQNGVLAGVSALMSYVFVILVLVWIGMSIFAALRIVSSAGESESIESAIKSIRNIWMGISTFIVFFVVVSIVGVFFGFGSVLDWSKNLAQCGPDAEFLFKVKEDKETAEVCTSGTCTVFVGCCAASASDPHEWIRVNSSGGSSAVGGLNCTVYDRVEVKSE